MTPPRLRPVPDAPARRRGLVLGAGGVLGASWTIGALRALEQTTGWDPREAEVIIGTSAGSVLAAFIASGITSETLENHQRGKVGPDDPLVHYEYDTAALPPRPRLRVGSAGLLRRTALHPRQVRPMAAFSALLPEGRGTVASVGALVDAVVPRGQWAAHPRTWVVAMDYETGRRVPFGRKGAPAAGLSEAVMASCAIPGWYAPIEINGRRYVDGGACSVTSLDLVTHLELDEVFVLSPMTSWSYDKPRSAVGRLERTYRRHVTRQLGREAERVRRHGTEVIMLGPSAEDLEVIGANLMDPRRREQVLDTSLRTSADALRREHPGLADTG